jgi:hypothetical protein
VANFKYVYIYMLRSVYKDVISLFRFPIRSPRYKQKDWHFHGTKLFPARLGTNMNGNTKKITSEAVLVPKHHDVKT